MLKDKKLEYENEWNDNKENFLENEKKKEDEEISTTTADNENKSQAAEVITLLKNIELFIKKKNYHYFNNSSPSNYDKGLLENLMKDDEKSSSENDLEENCSEVFKKYLILTKENLLELERQWDDEIFEDIRNFIILIDNPQEYNYFSTSFVIYKHEDKNEKFNSWLKNENILKKMNLDKCLKNDIPKEKDVFKEILNFDFKCQKTLESHLKNIEEMKESLNNLNKINLAQNKGNFDKITEKTSLMTDKNLFPQALNDKYEGNFINNIEKNHENDTQTIILNESMQKNKKTYSTPIKNSNIIDENKPKFEKNHNLEERIVSRSKNYIYYYFFLIINSKKIRKVHKFQMKTLKK